MNNLGLDTWLKKLNEETDDKSSGITKAKSGLASEKDYEQLPGAFKTMWRQYENAGGHKYESVWEFLDDVVGFLSSKGFTGRHIAEWDKKADREVGEE